MMTNEPNPPQIEVSDTQTEEQREVESSESMKTIKQVLVFAVATVALVSLVMWASDSVGFRHPGFAWLVNWFVVFWFVVTGSVFHFTLSPGYYRIRPFESDGHIYEYLGIRFCQNLLRRRPLSALSPALRLSGKTALATLEQRTRNAETGHLFIFLTMLLFVAYASLNCWWDAVAWLMLFNVLINVYPVMLQRYNRARLVPLIERAGRSANQASDA